MTWWLWLLVGLALLAIEMATPGGFFAFFFGLSALAVGVLAALGWAGPVWLQWLLFSALAVAGLALARAPLRRLMAVSGPQRPIDSLVGEIATVLEEWSAGGVGRVELRGSSWNARGAAALSRGQRCVVERVEGLTLWVRPE